MGQTFGYQFDNAVNVNWHPEVTPVPLDEPKNDPMMGFPNGRKERKVKTTKEEMYSAKVAHRGRDYCVDDLLKYESCRKDKWPFPVFCAHEKHAYLNCQYDDFVIRMKEYERERRLMVRANKQMA